MPDFKSEIRARLAELGLSPVRETEIVEELSQHLEEDYERALSSGVSEDAAREQVVKQLRAPDLLGCELKHAERCGSQQPVTPGTRKEANIFADLLQHVRCALRTRSAVKRSCAPGGERSRAFCCSSSWPFESCMMLK
jgi:hypothetical protein